MSRPFILCILIVTLYLSGCSNSVEPKKIEPIQAKHPREYAWTIDTLLFTPWPQAPGFTMIQDLWGVNDTLVFAACFDGWGGYGALWKFNGKCWERMKLGIWEGGPLTDRFEINAIEVKSVNDIYLLGSYHFKNSNPPPNSTFQLFALHFNGTVWQEVPIPKGERIFNVNHGSQTMIYGGGTHGQLFCFDGSRWTVDTVQTADSPESWMTIKVVGAIADTGVMIQMTQENVKTGTQTNELAIYANKRLTRIGMSDIYIPWGGEAFWKSAEGTVFSCGWNGVFRLSGSKWAQIKGTVEYLSAIGGTEDTHLFVCGDNNLFFYDGTTWLTLNTGSSLPYKTPKIWCTSNEVFVAFTNQGKTLIAHGK